MLDRIVYCLNVQVSIHFEIFFIYLCKKGENTANIMSYIYFSWKRSTQRPKSLHSLHPNEESQFGNILLLVELYTNWFDFNLLSCKMQFWNWFGSHLNFRSVSWVHLQHSLFPVWEVSSEYVAHAPTKCTRTVLRNNVGSDMHDMMSKSSIRWSLSVGTQYYLPSKSREEVFKVSTFGGGLPLILSAVW